jgi:transposase InsO family protein
MAEPSGTFRRCPISHRCSVSALADEGIYIASESTFGRVLSDEGQNAHRGRAKEPKQQRPATTHIANGPGELWCWDMTYLPTDITGRWFYRKRSINPILFRV